jgi:hypothetical protein
VKESIIIDLAKQAPMTCQNAREEILRQGAQRLLSKRLKTR